MHLILNHIKQHETSANMSKHIQTCISRRDIAFRSNYSHRVSKHNKTTQMKIILSLSLRLCPFGRTHLILLMVCAIVGAVDHTIETRHHVH